MSGRTLYICVAAVALAGALGPWPAAAQVDLSGAWRTLRHEDQPDRGPGVGYGDYTGIPLTAAARQFAESWDAARLSMPQQQCRVHVSPYIYRGPLNLRIWEEKDPQAKAQQRIHFFKNVSMLGGLLLASVDTVGKPGLAWRARHAAKDARREARHLAGTAKREAKLAAS